MPLVLNKRLGTWHYVTTTPDGTQLSVNLGTSNQELARQVLCQAAKEPGIPKSPTVEEARKEWRVWKYSVSRSRFTIEHQDQYLAAWIAKAEVGNVLPENVTVAHINAYINDDSPAKASSRRIRRAAISSFFNWCMASGYCTKNPTPLVEVNFDRLNHDQKETKSRTVFTTEEIDRLLRQLATPIQQQPPSNAFWRYAIIFGRDTGLRLGDLALIEGRALTKLWSESKLYVWTRKTDTRVDLSATRDMIGSVAPTVWVDKYVWMDAAKVALSVGGSAMLSVWFGRICKAAKVFGKSFHCLRHTYITACEAKGIPMDHIRKSVGHASQRMTERYVHRHTRNLL